jgi:hypothetical protein
LFFNNPAGLWALLGIPAILAIHFLQRQARVVPVSTLFLLEKTQRESASGRRFDRLMNSVPLWMQLLAVLLLTWLLTEPRYQKPRSTQRVAIVLDSSASMSVFKEALQQAISDQIPPLRGAASMLEITVMESATGSDRIYAGNSVEEAVAAITAWTPGAGVTDPTPALQIARSLAGRDGAVIFASDTPVEALPFDASLLTVGEPIENAGFTGISFEEKEGATVWSAVICNHGSSAAERTWQVRYPDGSATEPKPVRIEAGGLTAIQAALPAAHDRAIITLSADRFTLDDILPVVRPAPKSLKLFSATSPAFESLNQRLTRSLEAIELVDDAAEADLALVSYDPLDPALPESNAIVFVNDETRPGAYLKGGIVAEDHPYVAGLNWQPLLVRESIQLDRQPSDDVLLWQDTRPLIFLRETQIEGRAPSRQLCFNFDLRLSNAATQPAFIVCLHRFVEDLRTRKVAGFSANLETSQPIRLSATPGTPATVVVESIASGESLTRSQPGATTLNLIAPPTPAYLSVRQGEVDLLEAGVFFADTREADFKACATTSTVGQNSPATIERHTREDHWWRTWVIALLAALLVSWFYTKDRTIKENPQPGLQPAK